MKLILISYPTNIDNEHQILAHLFDEGLEYFHLRKPGFSKARIINYLSQIPDKYYNRIVIHSHYDLIRKYNLKGIHITSTINHYDEKFVNHQFQLTKLQHSQSSDYVKTPACDKSLAGRSSDKADYHLPLTSYLLTITDYLIFNYFIVIN